MFWLFLYPLLDAHSLKMSGGRILNTEVKKNAPFLGKKHAVHYLEFGYECPLCCSTKKLM